MGESRTASMSTGFKFMACFLNDCGLVQPILNRCRRHSGFGKLLESQCCRFRLSIQRVVRRIRSSSCDIVDSNGWAELIQSCDPEHIDWRPARAGPRTRHTRCERVDLGVCFRWPRCLERNIAGQGVGDVSEHRRRPKLLRTHCGRAWRSACEALFGHRARRRRLPVGCARQRRRPHNPRGVHAAPTK